MGRIRDPEVSPGIEPGRKSHQNLFRTRVIQRATRAFHRTAQWVEVTESKVDQDRMRIRVEKHVGSLDVLVTDAQAMKGVDGYTETAEEDY